MYGRDTLKFAFLFHTTASNSTDTTQLIISSHLLGVRWLDWSLDENTDVVLSLDSNSQQRNFHLTYLFYKAFVKVPSFNSCHWPVSPCKARNQHLKKHVFTKIWHLTINVLLLSALRQEPEWWREPALYHFLPGWELAVAAASALFELEVVAESPCHRGVCLCAVTGVNVLRESLWLCNSQWKHKLWSHPAVSWVYMSGLYACVWSRDGFRQNIF